MTIGNYDAQKVEKGVLKFWEENDIYPKLKKAREKGKLFYFLQGPPYTSGRLHMGHAWNSAMKDMVLRYKRLRGFNVWDRGGYDMHGLPTELKVQADLKLEKKEDIEKFGLKKFADECMKFAVKNAGLMSKDLWRMGVWMDHENAYMPVKNDYIENEWWLIKTAHDNGRLYRGLRTLSWCASCETAIAKHEQEYKTVKETSIFVKFPIKDRDKEYLIIWTTTPWTIAYNLAIMVNPELDYVKCKVGNEYWIMAKQLSAPIVNNFTKHKYEVVEEYKGKQLEGVEYVHPWESEIPDFKELKEKYPKVHTIILSKEFVDTSAGSGLVHSAPGCGPEDFEVCYQNNIPPFNNLSEQGVFPESMGRFKGLTAKKDDDKFVEALKDAGVLIAVSEVEHEYAHCWRCKKPVIFRATKQWFLKIEDLKEKMIKANQDVHWVPKQGKESYDLWTENLRDNSITKQRFWGTPAPIWMNVENEEDYIVVGSAKELAKYGVDVPENLHKPWIDDVVIEKNGKKYKRIPDVLDVWLDAGTASWNCLDYPKNKKDFERLFPADFILEAREQVRLWFSMLNICSFVTIGKQSYKNVYMTGMITDIEGVKMSKSLGNITSPYEIIDKHGSDTMRYYLSAVNAAQNIKFSWEEVALKAKYLMILWNIHKFLIDLAKQAGVNPAKLEIKGFKNIEEKYIMSRMNSAVEKVTALFDSYRLDETIMEIEKLYLDLSRTYIQLIRDKAAVGSDDEKKEVAYCIYNVLLNVVKMFSTIVPFITEAIYLNLKEEFGLKEESVHMLDWPLFDKRLINTELEKNMEIAGDIIQGVLFAREKIQQGLRWPLKEVIVTGKDELGLAVQLLGEIIKNQANVKELSVKEKLEGIKEKVKGDYAKIGPAFEAKSSEIIAHLATQSAESILKHISEKGKYEFKLRGENVAITKDHLMVERVVPKPYVEAEIRGGYVYIDPSMDEELEAEGYSREVMRRVQALRKKAGLEKQDKIILYVGVEEDLDLSKWEEQIQAKCGADKIKISSEKAARKHQFTDKVKIKDYEFEIAFDKI
ncbi:isoleucine--tRNA ligase [Candidatus Woesearchaeota archaeon]|nr:isoleucine--tRNA ligase [Candidatus Woesearchaeota archaeon]